MVRMYTPVSPLTQKGSATFIIKVYREHPDFPDGGKFSRALLEGNLQVGDSIDVEGPTGFTSYEGNGIVKYKRKPLLPKSKIGLISGGTGITPMLSIAQASILSQDGVDLTMLNFNKTKDDILCQEQLDELRTINAEKFKFYHSLTRHDGSDWDGLQGRLDISMLKQCGFPEPAPDVFIGICGPSSFTMAAKKLLKANGYKFGENFV